MDIIEFLTARLDEDEAVAQAVEDRSAPWDGQWRADGASAVRTHNGHVLVYACHGGDLKSGLAAHIALHDPARVLREVAAKRAILALHYERQTNVWPALPPGTPPGTPRQSHWEPAGVCECWVEGGDDDNWPCVTLRILAAVYADHPDYDQSWRP